MLKAELKKQCQIQKKRITIQQLFGKFPSLYKSNLFPCGRYNPDNNKNYRIFEKLGESKECKMSGALIKPFDPNLTGKYSYQ